MPKAPMTPQEVENIRVKILDTALSVIIEEGFNNLSVRKIASRINVTATTIYNYYTNKDELNLMIRIKGFQMMHDLLIERSSRHEDIGDKLHAMVRAYVDFGRSYPSYYDIMFNLHTPKYLDYVGTDMEPVAFNEKQNALRCLALFMDPISAHVPGKGKKKNLFLLNEVARFWSDLHGLVTLCNSRLFHEVLDDVDAFVEVRLSALVDDIMKLEQRIEEGEKLY